MNKLFLIVTLTLAIFLAACGPPEQAGGGGGDTGGGAQQAATTPTPVVLATPTPKPAPPTPTPRPSPTLAPIVSADDSAVDEGEPEAEAETEPVPEPIAENMVEIPAGPFTMGQNGSKPKNGPAHSVDLPAYTIDIFEVTNDEFTRFVDETGYVTYAEENSSKNWRDAAEGKGNHPVVYATWNDAAAYCEWRGARIPTEAEWEKAARGDDGRLYPWGNDYPVEGQVDTYGNFYETGLRSTFPVGAFENGASPYGVHDMAGNVREWVEDYFLAYEGASPDADPFFGEANRVNRGGGWFDGQDGELVTTYNRNAGPPDTSANDDIGFRCARDVE
ncbi:MAG TPA: SUMF1/EgtB/PvdO family nonheme iron enzyme [Anaerolineae bacterium]|jgi:formylglycine-generating enzyme required for sulfatase activity